MCGTAEMEMLHTDKFVKINTNNLNFLTDVHSWRWCWACGKRYLVVGLGVS
jgi:hypothetical protein